MNKKLEKVLKKMFKLVEADYPEDESYFKEPGWFWDYSVTEKQQDDFRKWMIDYLEKDREARIEMFDMRRKNSRLIKKGVDEFIFQFFWKLC